MYKVAVIGGRDTVLGFKALGLDAYPAVADDELKRLFRRVTKDDAGYAIIYIEETLAEFLTEEIRMFNDRPTPAIIMIPGRDGSKGLSMTALHESVLRAIGADIL